MQNASNLQGFSQVDTHFRIRYAATARTLARGVEILRRLAKR